MTCSAARSRCATCSPSTARVVWGTLDDAAIPSARRWSRRRRRSTLALSINEISHDVRWLPFRNAYQLAPGAHDRRAGSAARRAADHDGSRWPPRPPRRFPRACTRQLDALHAARAGRDDRHPRRRPGDPARAGRPTAAASTWCRANRAGASGARRSPAPGQAAGADGCTMSQAVAVSPGRLPHRVRCPARHAPSTRGFPPSPTLKVLTLCDGALPAAPTAAGRAQKKAR